MIPTGIGVVVALIGMALLVTAGVPTMFGFVLLCSLFGGSAAVSLPALGGSSIPPTQLALVFFLLRYLLPGSSQGRMVREALRANLPLILFVTYGVAIAYVGPRLFADQMEVVPMRFSGHAMFGTAPLFPTSQNITTPVYMVGTLFCAIGAYVACCDPRGARTLALAGVIIALVHMFFGISGAVLKNTAYDQFLSIFRNASYAQLDQRVGSLVRMNGIFPEPSAFAAYGFGWFVFLFECWYRDIYPKLTGPISVALLLTLLASTSSTAYIGVGAYIVIFSLRAMVLVSDVPSRKIAMIVAGLLVASVVVSAVLIAFPAVVDEAISILLTMTVEKQNSDSGLQRAFWAQQGLHNFIDSMGIGIGPGSFRSSSFVSAVAGSMGMVGLLTFGVYLMSVLKPLRASTYSRRISGRISVGVSATWAACCLLVVAAIGSPSPDPGSDFAMFAGAALALRKRHRAEPEPIDLPALPGPDDGRGRRREPQPPWPVYDPAQRVPKEKMFEDQELAGDKMKADLVPAAE